MPATPLDPTRLNAFVGRFVGDFGAALHAATIVLGDRLGLYRALAEAPATSAQLAERVGLRERLVREWLRAQAASGYVEYDAAADCYAMTPEQTFALADPNGLGLPGAFLVSSSLMKDEERIVDAFRAGGAFGWHEHHHDLFHGTERFFRASYRMSLVSDWIPALEGVQARLEAGAHVADVGCGHGASTVLMAQAFPRSRFTGFDYHEGSVRAAREVARAAGLADRVTFEVATAKTFDSGPYDLVACFDCLHDLGDPAGAAAHVRSRLAPDGTWLVVEPMAGDDVTANMNPVGRVFYSASTMICTPCSLAQEVGAALGAQAGEAQLREVITAGGFRHVRRAAETPFNLVLEARP